MKYENLPSPKKHRATIELAAFHEKYIFETLQAERNNLVKKSRCHSMGQYFAKYRNDFYTWAFRETNKPIHYIRKKMVQKVLILSFIGLVLLTVLSILTYHNSDHDTGSIEGEKISTLDINVMNCKILITENFVPNSIQYEYKINYLINYFSQKVPKIDVYNNHARITIESDKLLWKTCLLTLKISKDVILENFNINCNKECILVSDHSNMTILNGAWSTIEENDRLDVNIRNINVKNNLSFDSNYGTFQLNEFQIGGNVMIYLKFGDVILQSSSDIIVTWCNPSLAYCFAGPYIIKKTLESCSELGCDIEYDEIENEKKLQVFENCKGEASICREKECYNPSKIQTTQISGNTYVNLLPETGVDVYYNEYFSIMNDQNLNETIKLENYLQSEINKIFDENIQNNYPIIILNLGNKELQQQSYQKWILSPNPSFSYLRPWWLAVFSINLLTSKIYNFTGSFAPGSCPYHFAASKTEFIKIQDALSSFYKIEGSEISYVKPMTMEQSLSDMYENGTGVANFSLDKPVSEVWLKIIKVDAEGNYSIAEIDIFSNNFILPTLILSFIGAGLIGIFITRLFMIGIVIAHKKIINSALHTQNYTKRSVEFRDYDGDKIFKELEEVEDSPDGARINIGTLLTESSFLVFMKTVPRISSFFGFYSYTLIKTYMLNSVEDFCNVLFQKQTKKKLEKLRKFKVNKAKFAMKEFNLKSYYEQFCFLNHYPELSLRENVRIFKAYGYEFVPDKEALAFSNLVERRNIILPSAAELKAKNLSETFDCIFDCLYERSNIESDTICMEEIKTNCFKYFDKNFISKDFVLNIQDFICNHNLKKVYKESLKLIYNENMVREDTWYLRFFVCIINLFLSVLSLCRITDYKIITRKKTYYSIDEETLKEQINLLFSDYLNSENKNWQNVLLSRGQIDAINKTLFYPWNSVHEFFYILLHFSFTGCLIFPMLCMVFIYEINYEPFSTISSDMLFSLKDLLWNPLKIPSRLFAFIEWNIVIIIIIFTQIIFNLIDNLYYFLSSGFPEDKKFLKFQQEINYKIKCTETYTNSEEKGIFFK